MDLTRAIGWLYGLWPTILSALWTLGSVVLAALLSALFMSWFQDRRRARREHRDAIKNQVLGPLREQLEEFHLPLLRGEFAPVTLEDVTIPLEGSVTERSTAWDCTLAPRRTRVRHALPFDPLPKPGSELNPELYDDAKRNHYGDFIRRLEAFKAVVESYSAGWLGHAEDLYKAITIRTQLPLVRWDLVNTDLSWINAKGLAVFVIERQLGVTTQIPSIQFHPPNRFSVEMSGRTMAQAGTEEQIRRVIAALDELYFQRDKVDNLLRPAESLGLEARAMLTKLNQLLLSSKLPGRCALANV